MTRATTSKEQIFPRGIVALVVVSIAAGTLGCDRPGPPDDTGAQGEEFDGTLEPRGALQKAELREDDGVVDGDTFRIVGFEETVRPLCIDTEEVLEGDALQEARRDWEAYRDSRTGEGDEPVDYGTPYGNRGTEWAEEFFANHGPEVWLEYASPKRTRGFFGRHLAYVWVRDDGDEWLNFNVEAVRAGMSPYYTNYGRCPEYEEAFGAAQREARQARRGIWDPETRSYRDYDERLEIWEERADRIETFRTRFEATPGVVELGTDTALSRLRFKVGERVVVFGAVADIVEGADPPRLELYHRHRRPLRVQLGQAGVDGLNVEPRENQYVYVFGTVRMYRGDPVLEVGEGGFVRSGDDPPATEEW